MLIGFKMCTPNQERICFFIEGRASLPLRGIISEARRTFSPHVNCFFKNRRKTWRNLKNGISGSQCCKGPVKMTIMGPFKVTN